MYNNFIEHQIPKHWAALQKKDYNKILKFEQNYYHLITKNPDSLDSFNRFFLNVEPLLLAAASNYLQDVKNRLLNISSAPIEFLKDFVDKKQFSYFVVLKGSYDLAHGNLLLSVLSRLQRADKFKICLVLLDYDQNNADIISKELENLPVIGLEHVNQDKSKLYFYLSYLVSQTKAPKVKVTFWGVPFGIVFAGFLLKKMNTNVIVRYVTLKHLHSFPPQSVDICAAQYHVLNSMDYVNNTLTVLDRLPFTKKQLEFQLPTQKNDQNVRNLILEIQQNNPDKVLISSLCRIEKCLNNEYIRCISSIDFLTLHFLVFAREENKFHLFRDQSNIKSMSYIGWMLKINSMIDLIDIYIDPLPHGGGFSLALAMFNQISCVIPPRDITKSPSGLHEVSRIACHYKDDFVLVGNQKNYHMKLLFPSDNDKVSRAIKLLSESKELRYKHGNWCQKIALKSFLYSTNQNLKNCFGMQ